MRRYIIIIIIVLAVCAVISTWPFGEVLLGNGKGISVQLVAAQQRSPEPTPPPTYKKIPEVQMYPPIKSTPLILDIKKQRPPEDEPPPSKGQRPPEDEPPPPDKKE